MNDVSSINIYTLISVIGVVIIPGLLAWIQIKIQVARLEERVDAREKDTARLESKIDELSKDIKEMYEMLLKK